MGTSTRSWWRVLEALLLLVGVVLLPFHAMAGAIPVRAVSAAIAGHTTTTRIEGAAATRHETKNIPFSTYDATIIVYDGSALLRKTACAGGVYAYDGRLEQVGLHELEGRPIYDERATVPAAEGLEATLIAGPGGSLIRTGLSPAELLIANGVRIGEAGASAGIRVIQGGATEAQMMFEQLATGGTPFAGSYAGTAVSLPGGGFVGMRALATGTGARAVPVMTIDVNIPGIAIRELKFVP